MPPNIASVPIPGAPAVISSEAAVDSADDFRNFPSQLFTLSVSWLW